MRLTCRSLSRSMLPSARLSCQREAPLHSLLSVEMPRVVGGKNRTIFLHAYLYCCLCIVCYQWVVGGPCRRGSVGRKKTRRWSRDKIAHRRPTPFFVISHLQDPARSVTMSCLVAFSQIIRALLPSFLISSTEIDHSSDPDTSSSRAGDERANTKTGTEACESCPAPSTP